MTEPPEHLRESLRHLADAAEAVDLYERALRRSHRIARREATVGGAAALVALTVLASALWRVPSGGTTDTPAAAPVLLPTVVHSAPAPPPGRIRTYASPEHPARITTSPRHTPSLPRIARTSPVSPSRSLADLPGHLFYQRAGDQPDVVRFFPEQQRTDTVLADAPSPVGISPDGDRIAYAQDGDLLVKNTDAARADRVAAGVTTADQAPAWSPDGERLLVDAEAPAVVDVGSGKLTPLPGDLGDGRHFRWSGDGSKLVYATPSCGLQVTAGDAGPGSPVPAAGRSATTEPDDGACEATSVDETGSRVTVPSKRSGAQQAADAVIDTATGDRVALPVTGTVVGAVFDPDGNLLVRTVSRAGTRLWLVGPDNTVLVRADEPAALRDLDLLAYTR